MLPVSLIATKPTLIVGGIVVGACLLWGGWHYLRAERAEKALLEYQAAAAAVIAERLEANAELERQARDRLKETTDAYETRLGTLRARYDRLRKSSNGSSGSMPQAPGGQGGVVDAAPDSAGGYLPRCVQDDRREELIELLEAADTCAERLKACQSAWR